MTSERKSNRKPPPVETRFKPGQSGNPAGRKPGKPLPQVIAENIDPEDVKRVVQRVIDAALDGDLTAAELVLRRCWPAAKPVAVDLDALAAELAVVKASGVVQPPTLTVITGVPQPEGAFDDGPPPVERVPIIEPQAPGIGVELSEAERRVLLDGDLHDPAGRVAAVVADPAAGLKPPQSFMDWLRQNPRNTSPDDNPEDRM